MTHKLFAWLLIYNQLLDNLKKLGNESGTKTQAAILWNATLTGEQVLSPAIPITIISL
jgi:hypothetical protein